MGRLEFMLLVKLESIRFLAQVLKVLTKRDADVNTVGLSRLNRFTLIVQCTSSDRDTILFICLNKCVKNCSLTRGGLHHSLLQRCVGMKTW